jgi:hypothetical protein
MRSSWPTAQIVTRWLRSSGTLASGEVLDVQIELEHETLISELLFLTATYTPEAPKDLPRQIVVKSPLVKTSVADYSPDESQFYREVAPVLGTPPVIRCLAAIEDDDTNTETLVLEDLRATHDHPPWPIPPSRKQCEMAIDALALIHAKCWEASALGDTIGKSHTSESLTSMVQGVAAQLPAFLDTVGDALPIESRHIYERVFASSLKPWLRLTNPHALTIIHGDAHTWNFLFPRSGSGAAYLIDWQLWHIDVGTRDLAYFMALHWYPDRRRELETPLIKRYHEALLRQSITNYTYDDLWLDYRRCVVRNLTIPVLNWSQGMKPKNWWHRLECALAAYQELQCDELL